MTSELDRLRAGLLALHGRLMDLATAGDVPRNTREAIRLLASDVECLRTGCSCDALNPNGGTE